MNPIGVMLATDFNRGRPEKLETRRLKMSKAQTDIRATSYDARYANPNGYQGTIDDALAQIRAEPGRIKYSPTEARRRVRGELLHYLGVSKLSGESKGPSTADDQDVRYGAPPLTLAQRIERLDSRQQDIYSVARLLGRRSVEQALLLAEYYPFPTPVEAQS
jgi:hypothetical protein